MEEKYSCDFGAGWNCIYPIHNCPYSIKGVCANPFKNSSDKLDQTKETISENFDHLTDNIIKTIENHL